MTIRKTMYPKTTRIKNENGHIVITEKLDGSNLGFGKVNDELWIYQRNSIYKLKDLEEAKQATYKGLYQWLKDNGGHLEEQLHENSIIFGEWIGMAHIKYPEDFGRFHIFAKANYDDVNDCAKNILYKHELLIYPFKDQVIPSYMKVVPIVAILEVQPSVEELDELYTKYTSTLDRQCEGFVIQLNENTIKKYVRLKRGKLQNHKEGK